MADQRKPKVYRDVIDALVKACRSGQGQIGADRARKGIWNVSATPGLMADQHEINLLLAKLSGEDREVLANMLAHQVEVGVFETLKALEAFKIAPFLDGYEDSAYNDFIGRLDGWEWPTSS